MEALGAIGFFVLVLHAAAHVALAVAVARARPSRGALALVFSPLGAAWAWEAGKRPYVIAWGATLAVFSAIVTVIAYAR